MQDQADVKKNTILWLTVLAFLALGFFFRVSGLGERDLWTDEAWVALAATQPTPAAVLQAGKSTPPLYSLTVWGLVQVLGKSEAVLRLTSLLFGVGALVLFWPLARGLLPLPGALLAFILASLSPRLVYFSKELKQYSADVFFAVLVFYLVERQLRRQGQGGWLLFTVLLALGLGYSHPVIFIIAAAAPVLWWRLPQARKTIFGVFGALSVFFLGSYWLFFQGQVDPELLIYWRADFPDLTCGTDFFCWLGAAWTRYVRYFSPEWSAPLGAVFLAAGLVFAGRSPRPRLIWYFFGPILACLAAAAAQRYPFMGQAGGVRLMMFSAPMLYLLTGAGIGAIFQWLWPPPAAVSLSQGENSGPGPAWRWLGTLVLLGVVLLWLQPTKLWRENLHPQQNREDIKMLVRYLEIHRRSGEVLYVYYFAKDPFNFYFQGPTADIILGQSCHDQCLPLPPERLEQLDRIWLLFSHFETQSEMERFSDNLLGPGWTREFTLAQPGALLFSYTPLRPRPPGPAVLNPPGP